MEPDPTYALPRIHEQGVNHLRVLELKGYNPPFKREEAYWCREENPTLPVALK